jgi:uncharacterized protein (DUF1919 family)
MIFFKKLKIKCLYYINIVIDYFYSIYAKKMIKNKSFCIICNNCYGGHLYQTIGRPYNTPTVGLYFFAEDYIKFIENLEDCLKQDLKFISKSRFEESYEEHSQLQYPIGLLPNNIEIHFLHYKTESEALSKWNRRKERVDLENISIIMNDQNRFTNNLFERFEKIIYKKIFLSSKPVNYEFSTFISYYKKDKTIGNMYADKIKCLRDFNLISWIIKK